MSMRTEILMVTYARDLAWAKYSLQSIQKFCTGFAGVTIVVPNEDVDAFRQLPAPHGAIVKGFHEMAGKGMLAHMACKMEADIWCPDAQAILHLDADTLFWEDCTPDDFFVDGKPIVLRERYEDFKDREARYSWKACVKAATGIDPVWETMCRHPLVNLSPTYSLARRLMTNHVGMDWKQWWMRGQNSFPQNRCEHNTLGAVAIEHAAHLYHFVDWSCAKTNNNYIYEHGRDKVTAFWSHGGFDEPNDRHPGRTAREVIKEILA